MRKWTGRPLANAFRAQRTVGRQFFHAAAGVRLVRKSVVRTPTTAEDLIEMVRCLLLAQ